MAEPSEHVAPLTVLHKLWRILAPLSQKEKRIALSAVWLALNGPRSKPARHRVNGRLRYSCSVCGKLGHDRRAHTRAEQLAALLVST